MLIFLLIVIAVLLALIWIDAGMSARATRKLITAASDLNLEAQVRTQEKLEDIEHQVAKATSRLPMDQ
jgi:cell division protein FtsL